MKRIIVVAQFEAYVPDDMTVSQVEESVDEIIRNKLEGFSVYVKDYPVESEQCPMFDLTGVQVGTELQLAIGGD